MKVQFFLAACVGMMIGTLIFMYQAALPSNVVEVSVADQSAAAQAAAAKLARRVNKGESDDVKISNHQARAGL